ncbi:MAG: hypothetical protein Q4C71_06210 [Microbacteriaceae bacterium]|nr:hypothetical protein [Microbacteriaceae bacterium]
MRRRIFTTTALLAAGALLLSGCGHSAQDQQNALAKAQQECGVRYAPGAVSDKVKVAAGGEMPEKVATAPDFQVTDAQVSRSVQGSVDHKRLVKSGDVLVAEMAVYNGKTGERLYASKDSGNDGGQKFQVIPPQEQDNSFAAAMRCAAAGERLTVVFSPEETEQLEQQTRTNLGGRAVLVLDVKAISGGKAEGHEHALPYGYPAVTRVENGHPGVIKSLAEAPSKLDAAVRIAGNGAKIESADNIVARVFSVSWKGEILEDNWNTPGALLGSEQAPVVSWRGQLTGKKVGSQVVVLLPATDKEPAQSVIVDILAASH